MKYFARRSILQDLRAKLGLVLVMFFIGIFTVYASANTFEVIAGEDIRVSSVVETVRLTTDKNTNDAFKKAADNSYNEGDFGIPQKMKLPETKQHIEIIEGDYNDIGWKAKAGSAQLVVTADERQKVFGEAVVYMRYNTSTTRHLGEVLVDDIMNIVTTDGWQLGYRVLQAAQDPMELDKKLGDDFSRIIVVLIDDEDGKTKCFQASLEKVGERV